MDPYESNEGPTSITESSQEWHILNLLRVCERDLFETNLQEFRKIQLTESQDGKVRLCKLINEVLRLDPQYSIILVEDLSHLFNDSNFVVQKYALLSLVDSFNILFTHIVASNGLVHSFTTDGDYDSNRPKLMSRCKGYGDEEYSYQMSNYYSNQTHQPNSLKRPEISDVEQEQHLPFSLDNIRVFESFSDLACVRFMVHTRLLEATFVGVKYKSVYSVPNLLYNRCRFYSVNLLKFLFYELANYPNYLCSKCTTGKDEETNGVYVKSENLDGDKQDKESKNKQKDKDNKNTKDNKNKDKQGKNKNTRGTKSREKQFDMYDTLYRWHGESVQVMKVLLTNNLRVLLNFGNSVDSENQVLKVENENEGEKQVKEKEMSKSKKTGKEKEKESKNTKDNKNKDKQELDNNMNNKVTNGSVGDVNGNNNNLGLSDYNNYPDERLVGSVLSSEVACCLMSFYPEFYFEEFVDLLVPLLGTRHSRLFETVLFRLFSSTNCYNYHHMLLEKVNQYGYNLDLKQVYQVVQTLPSRLNEVYKGNMVVVDKSEPENEVQKEKQFEVTDKLVSSLNVEFNEKLNMYPAAQLFEFDKELVKKYKNIKKSQIKICNNFYKRKPVDLNAVQYQVPYYDQSFNVDNTGLTNTTNLNNLTNSSNLTSLNGGSNGFSGSSGVGGGLTGVGLPGVSGSNQVPGVGVSGGVSGQVSLRDNELGVYDQRRDRDKESLVLDKSKNQLNTVTDLMISKNEKLFVRLVGCQMIDTVYSYQMFLRYEVIGPRLVNFDNFAKLVMNHFLLSNLVDFEKRKEVLCNLLNYLAEYVLVNYGDSSVLFKNRKFDEKYYGLSALFSYVNQSRESDLFVKYLEKLNQLVVYCYSTNVAKSLVTYRKKTNGDKQDKDKESKNKQKDKDTTSGSKSKNTKDNKNKDNKNTKDSKNKDKELEENNLDNENNKLSLKRNREDDYYMELYEKFVNLSLTYVCKYLLELEELGDYCVHTLSKFVLNLPKVPTGVADLVVLWVESDQPGDLKLAFSLVSNLLKLPGSLLKVDSFNRLGEYYYKYTSNFTFVRRSTFLVFLNCLTSQKETVSSLFLKLLSSPRGLYNNNSNYTLKSLERLHLEFVDELDELKGSDLDKDTSSGSKSKGKDTRKDKDNKEQQEKEKEKELEEDNLDKNNYTRFSELYDDCLYLVDRPVWQWPLKLVKMLEKSGRFKSFERLVHELGSLEGGDKQDKEKEVDVDMDKDRDNEYNKNNNDNKNYMNYLYSNDEEEVNDDIGAWIEESVWLMSGQKSLRTSEFVKEAVSRLLESSKESKGVEDKYDNQQDKQDKEKENELDVDMDRDNKDNKNTKDNKDNDDQLDVDMDVDDVEIIYDDNEELVQPSETVTLNQKEALKYLYMEPMLSCCMKSSRLAFRLSSLADTFVGSPFYTRCSQTLAKYPRELQLLIKYNDEYSPFIESLLEETRKSWCDVLFKFDERTTVEKELMMLLVRKMEQTPEYLIQMSPFLSPDELDSLMVFLFKKYEKEKMVKILDVIIETPKISLPQHFLYSTYNLPVSSAPSSDKERDSMKLQVSLLDTCIMYCTLGRFSVESAISSLYLIVESFDNINFVFGRLLCQFVQKIPLTRKVIVDVIFPKLVQKQCWQDKQLFKGVVITICTLWNHFKDQLLRYILEMPNSNIKMVLKALQGQYNIAEYFKTLNLPSNFKEILDDVLGSAATSNK